MSPIASRSRRYEQLTQRRSYWRAKEHSNNLSRSVVSWTMPTTSVTCPSLPTVRSYQKHKSCLPGANKLPQSTTESLPSPTLSFSVPVLSQQPRLVRLVSQTHVLMSRNVVSPSSPLPSLFSPHSLTRTTSRKFPASQQRTSS